MNLNLRPKEECQFDAVSLGEVMLRLIRVREESVQQELPCMGRRRRVQRCPRT